MNGLRFDKEYSTQYWEEDLEKIIIEKINKIKEEI